MNPDYLIPGTRVGAYVVRTMLGQGGSASVYEVESAEGHRFALKMCRRQSGSYGTDEWRADQRYARSILCLQQLKGVRNVVELYAHDRYPDPLHGFQYFVQELVPGSLTITRWVKRESPSLRKLVTAFLELAELFDKLADADICHRDVKPENILVAPDGTPKVIGFASAVCYRGPRVTRRAASGVPGSRGYLSPELCLALLKEKRTGEEEPFEAHPWGDMYGLGVVFYECLIGEHPFDLSLPEDRLLQEIAYEDPLQPIQLNAAVPFALNKMVMKLLSKNPLHRYPYGELLANDLRALLEKVADERWDKPFRLPVPEDGVVPIVSDETVLGLRAETPLEQGLALAARALEPEPVALVLPGPSRPRVRWGRVALVVLVVAGLAIAFAAGFAVALSGAQERHASTRVMPPQALNSFSPAVAMSSFVLGQPALEPGKMT